jgi:ABC-2 type transport system permease protein
VFSHLHVSAAARHTLAPGVTWWGWHVPVPLEAAMVLAIGLAAIGLAVLRFARTE